MSTHARSGQFEKGIKVQHAPKDCKIKAIKTVKQNREYFNYIYMNHHNAFFSAKLFFIYHKIIFICLMHVLSRLCKLFQFDINMWEKQVVKKVLHFVIPNNYRMTLFDLILIYFRPSAANLNL